MIGNNARYNFQHLLRNRLVRNPSTENEKACWSTNKYKGIISPSIPFPIKNRRTANDSNDIWIWLDLPFWWKLTESFLQKYSYDS